MDESLKLIVYGGLNIILAALSGASGVGAGIVTVPLLAALGLSPSTAIATSKFSAFGQALGSSSRYYREKIVDKKQFLVFGGLGIIAGVIGSIGLVAIKDQQELIENIIGAVILLIGVPLLYLKKRGLELQSNSKYIKASGYTAMFVVMVFVSAIGSGVGTLQGIVLMSFFGLSALKAVALQRAILLVNSSVVLVIFIASGLIDYKFGLVGIISAVVGSYIGAHVAVKKGDKLVTNLLAAMSVALALYLIVG